MSREELIKLIANDIDTHIRARNDNIMFLYLFMVASYNMTIKEAVERFEVDIEQASEERWCYSEIIRLVPRKERIELTMEDVTRLTDEFGKFVMKLSNRPGNLSKGIEMFSTGFKK